MAQGHIRYENSPLIQAIIDIVVELPPEKATVTTFDPVHDLIRDRYPKREDLMMVKAQLALNTPVTSSESKLGYVFRSPDSRYEFQAKTNGFTFVRMQPYLDWESFRDNARELWLIYKQIAEPRLVKRVAVRYINRIEIPQGARIEDYFRTYPELSDDLPQLVQGLLMQFVVQYPKDGITLSLIQATVPNAPVQPPGGAQVQPEPKKNVAAINLDIDLFKQSDTDFDTEEKVWAFLEVLRRRKDEVFEASITDRSRQMFEPTAE